MLGDIANVCHEVCNVSATVGHLLVNVVILENFVDGAEHTGDVLVDEDDLFDSSLAKLLSCSHMDAEKL